MVNIDIDVPSGDLFEAVGAEATFRVDVPGKGGKGGKGEKGGKGQLLKYPYKSVLYEEEHPTIDEQTVTTKQ